MTQLTVRYHNHNEAQVWPAKFFSQNVSKYEFLKTYKHKTFFYLPRHISFNKLQFNFKQNKCYRFNDVNRRTYISFIRKGGGNRPVEALATVPNAGKRC